MKHLRSEIEGEGYTFTVRLSDRRTVHSAFVRFGELLHELALSPHPEEAVAVKIEVDTRPPAGAILETRLVRRYVPLRLRHHDRGSLLAGKLHAVLQRPYVKGRDFYDLAWYLSDPEWAAPNLTLLNHALAQTRWSAGPLLEATWRAAVARRIRKLDWDRVVHDVRPFWERELDMSLLARKDLLRLLAN